MGFIFDYLTEGLREGSEDILQALSKYSIKMLDQQLIINILHLMKVVGYALFAIGVLLAIGKLAVSYLDGDGEVNLHYLFLNIFKGIVFLATWQEICIFIYNLCLNLQDALKNVVDLAPHFDTTINQIDGLLGISVLWKFVALLFLIISVLISLFQCLKRGIVYVIHISLGYIYAFSIAQGNIDGIFNWAKTTLSVALTNCFQVALILAGMKAFENVETIPLSIGFLGAAMGLEKVMGYFGYSTGTVKQLAGASRTAISVMQLVGR